MPVKVTVCVGSSCHIRGSRALVKRFAEVIRRENFEPFVELVGSFCMEQCGEAMNWKFDGEYISSRNVDEAEEALRGRLAQVERQA